MYCFVGALMAQAAAICCLKNIVFKGRSVCCGFAVAKKT